MMLHTKLEDQSREELLETVRHILVEAEALSSRIVAVNEIGIAINHTLDIDKIFEVVAIQAKWLLDFEHSSICLLDNQERWGLKVLHGEPCPMCSEELYNSEIGEAIKRGQSRLVRPEDNTEFLPQYSSKIIIPLDSENEIIGTINFAGNKSYTHDDMRIAYLLALQLASAIRNARRMKILHATQQKLENYAQELELQNQELDAYSYTIAHDLKSPLSVIPIKAGLVKMYAHSLPVKAIEHLNDITQRSKYMADMIDQLLLLSKLRDDTETLQRINVNKVVERCLTRFPEIEMGHIKVHVQENLPTVIGQAQWLEEVFANLISNAVKYMGDDNPTPQIRIIAKITGHEAQFSVVDNGVGIRQEDQASLFKMFTRLKDVQAEGLGLGLSIVHRIVERLGGKLGVESEWGYGTNFWFTIPVLPSQPPK